MKHRLPPLKALIAAENVYQLGSFKKAGDSLHVTPSAISHQVRLLEEWLGFRLFNRDTRSLELTESGKRYLDKVSALFSQLEADTEVEMERVGKSHTIRLQTTDSFANRWLVEALDNFSKEMPNTHIKIVTFEYTEQFKPMEADMAILYGRGNWANGKSQLIFSESIFPVCSPKLLTKEVLGNPVALLSQALIQDSNLGVNWQQWCDFADVTIPSSNMLNGPVFNHSHLAIKSAELGNGITLASEPLVSYALRNGTLIAPFDIKMPTDDGYYAIESLDSSIQKRCQRIFEWLYQHQEIAQNTKTTLR